MEAKRALDAEAANATNKREDELKCAIKEAEKKLKSIMANSSLLSAEIMTSSDDHKKLIEQACPQPDTAFRLSTATA